MKIIIGFIFFIGLSIFPLNSQTCNEIIKNLSNEDKCLSSREIAKREIAKNMTSASDFVSRMKNESKCNGTYYSCGYTRSWVSEIFEGLSIQFEENKYSDYKSAGYENLIGKNFTNFFKKKMNSTNNSIIYHLKHTGTHDHDYVLEQLSNKKGYRLYQSYNSAYSLKAWLSENITNLYEKGEIMLPLNMISQIKQLLASYNASLDNLEGLPNELKGFLPYLTFVKNLNQSVVEKNFIAGWEKYGKNKILNESTILEYIGGVEKLTDYFNENDNTNKILSEEIFNLWIELYSSPDPVYFPGMPINFLINILWPGEKRVYRFEVLANEISNNETLNSINCLENERFMMARDSKNENNITVSNITIKNNITGDSFSNNLKIFTIVFGVISFIFA